MSNTLTPPEPGGVWLDHTAFRLLLRLETARRALVMWSEERDKARDLVRAILGDAQAGFYQGARVVTVSRSRPTRFDQTLFAVDHPQLYADYTRAADEDVVRVTLARHLPGMPVQDTVDAGDGGDL